MERRLGHNGKSIAENNYRPYKNRLQKSIEEVVNITTIGETGDHKSVANLTDGDGGQRQR